MPRVTLNDLAERFDGFLIDQYGVLRDDSGIYLGAVAALALLRARGKATVILSNSGRSAADNRSRMAKAGIAADLYDYFVSSGEVAFDLLRHDTAALRGGVFELSTGSATDLPERLNLPRVATPAEAGLVLISGAATETVAWDTYRDLLAGPAAAGVPAICTNPDLHKIGPGGAILPGAGALADLYEQLGGSVRYIGKPHPDIYRAALARLPHLASDRILCIGDSPAHDIAGARAMGLASCLVETGVGATAQRDGFLSDLVMAAFAP